MGFETREGGLLCVGWGEDRKDDSSRAGHADVLTSLAADTI